MDPSPFFAFQFLWFLCAWTVVAVLFVAPLLRHAAFEDALAIWIAPQLFRVLGVGLLVPNLAPGMPRSFALPTALGDSASEPRFIETLPRRGYRFIAPVTEGLRAAAAPAAATSARSGDRAGRGWTSFYCKTTRAQSQPSKPLALTALTAIFVPAGRAGRVILGAVAVRRWLVGLAAGP